MEDGKVKLVGFEPIPQELSAPPRTRLPPWSTTSPVEEVQAELKIVLVNSALLTLTASEKVELIDSRKSKLKDVAPLMLLLMTLKFPWLVTLFLTSMVLLSITKLGVVPPVITERDFLLLIRLPLTPVERIIDRVILSSPEFQMASVLTPPLTPALVLV
ncbi:MAG: hypothetical protein FWC38_07180 [Proteobacteria bacterium]|nr:hypothetical protein [Pseudomonadota bacterium]MCL2307986.1 hypothetical protein [Pseudomonadota bacterium]